VGRWSDWAFYAGIAFLLGTVALTFFGPEFLRLWWALFIGGVVLVAASALPWLRDLRTTLTGRTARHGLHAVVTILFVLGIVGFVEALSYRHNKSVDLTENRRHSLSPQTIQLLRGLKTDVKALGFFRPDQPGKRVADGLLAQYARYSNGRFSWEVVDLDLGPKLAAKYGVESYGTIIFEANGKNEKVLDVDEEKLTNALVKVTREGKRVVYVLQGHGEPDLGNSERTGFSAAKLALERANHEVKPLVLARETRVPDDASVVVVAGPRIELFGPEAEALGAYLARGGRLLVMLSSPMVQRVQDATLRKLLVTYGIEAAEDLVIEYGQLAQLSGLGPMVPIVVDYDAHAITRELGVMTVFPLTRSLNQAKGAAPGPAFTVLARTSAQSWSETNREEVDSGRLKMDPGEKKGPLVVAAAATKDKSRLVVYGAAALAVNEFLGIAGNRDLFLNSVSWLAGDEEQIALRPKDSRVAPIFLTQVQERAVNLISLVILPGLALFAGIAVVVVRRSAK
jgi:ABC-type uncharacterized transport system involved in gliding motility auxiliary subunit